MGKPGTILHGMIKQWTGQEPRLSCKCMLWIKKMDRDPEWARANTSLITAKLLKEAKKRAVEWRAVPVDENGGMLNFIVNRTWKGAFMIPGSGVFLEPFVHAMVLEAIRRSEV